MNVTPTDLLEPADPLTPKQALAEREDLQRDLANVKDSVDAALARDREIKVESKRIKAGQADARKEAVRKGGRIDQGKERQKLDALEAEAEEIADTIEAARTVRTTIETELHYLHVQQFEAFAEHAETLSADAAKALDDLRPAFEEATRKWEIAESEWNALVRFHNDGRGSEPGPTIRPDGSVRTSDDAAPKLSQAPRCPLPPVADVFGGDPPRPPELEVEADPD